MCFGIVERLRCRKTRRKLAVDVLRPNSKWACRNSVGPTIESSCAEVRRLLGG